MRYFVRLLGDNARKDLARGKSILLLGPRQTGKTTFVREQLKPDIEISFVQAKNRLRYEKAPALLEKELEQVISTASNNPLVFIDEVQKIPRVMDSMQYLIDKYKVSFIMSGSSARKLKSGNEVNLLPGRVVNYTLSPLLFTEIPQELWSLDNFLLYGSLPGVVNQVDTTDKELDLTTYVTTYLEDEIRTEAAVRNVGNFAQFLQLAAGESNKQINLTRLSQDIGVAASTISAYWQILVDCLIVHRIMPITKSKTKRRLLKSAKYMFFDMGIRRACANEGIKLSQVEYGNLFEQFVGLQLLALSNLKSPLMKIRYWRDSAGPEVDFVMEYHQQYIPVEVKYSEAPRKKDAANILKFINEYSEATHGYIVCRTPHSYQLNDQVTVIPWQDIESMLEIMD